jgi:hypothetical protein
MDPSQFNKSTVISDDDIVVEDSAKKHQTQFGDGTRFPTDGDVKREFKAAVKFGGVPQYEAQTKVWKWEESGTDLSCKPPRIRKRNNICFKVVNNKCVVFHYHKGFYG